MSWKKTLKFMSGDADPQGYTYEDAAYVLNGLGFELANSRPNGSHRVWRRPDPDGNVHGTVIVGLVKNGHGTMKPVYIRQMITILRDAGLIPLEQEDDGSMDV